MNGFEKHLLENKTKFVRLFGEDIKKDFGIEVPEGHGVTQSDFFHFGEVDGLKYVHKEALRFVLTNGETYIENQPELAAFEVEDDARKREAVEAHIKTIFDFFRNEINEHPLYPEFVKESERFFVFKYYRREDGWGRINFLSRADAKYIRENYKPLKGDPKTYITPLYNQMMNKVFKNKKSGEIKFVDLKSFEARPKGRPMIYFYNGDINQLYLLGINIMSRRKAFERFEMDYPVENARVQRFFF